jgi:hypothetical protein
LSGSSASTGTGTARRRRVERAQALLRQVEEDGDRLHLRDHHEAGRVRAHEVAGIDEPDAGAAVARRTNGRVVEIGLGAVDRALVRLHLRLELGDGRTLGVGLLGRARIALGQARVTIEIEPGVGEVRLVLRLAGDRLIVLSLVDRRIDARDDVAALHVLAFADRELHEAAFDLGPHRHGRERLRRADRFQRDWHVRVAGRRGQDRDRPVSPARPRPPRRPPRPSPGRCSCTPV